MMQLETIYRQAEAMDQPDFNWIIQQTATMLAHFEECPSTSDPDVLDAIANEKNVTVSKL